MRELKFRAYDKHKKLMIYDLDQSLGEIYNLSPGDWIHPLIWKIGQLNDSLMQYTGLKDKNGKEIYEGDIVKIKAYVYNDAVFIGEVKYGQHTLFNERGYCGVETLGFYVTDNDSTYFISPADELTMFCEMEVIGNIWENPELLENK